MILARLSELKVLIVRWHRHSQGCLHRAVHRIYNERLLVLYAVNSFWKELLRCKLFVNLGHTFLHYQTTK